MRKMKKSERIELIHKRAHELAKSGKYTDWLSIEYALRADDLIEARSELDRDYLRKELDELCKRARSDEEIQSRTLFNAWLGNFIEQNKAQINVEFPNVNIYTSEKYFSISADKEGYEIRKDFGTKKLIGDYIFEEKDGKRYRTFNSYNSQKDFDEFTIQDLKDLAKNISS